MKFILSALSIGFLTMTFYQSTIAAEEPAKEEKTVVVSAADTDAIHPGKEIHDKHCLRCHTDGEKYTREDRKVTSLVALATQVKACDAMLELKLFDEDMEQITDYLNQEHYKFEKEKKEAEK